MRSTARHLTAAKGTPRSRSSSSPLSILKQCTSTETIKQTHAQIIVTGRFQDTFLATKLLEACAVSARNVPYARRIFDRIDRPNSYTWTTMMRAFSEAKFPDKVIEFYELMRSDAVAVAENRFTFIYALKAYGLRTRLSDGRTVHGKVVKAGFECDVYVNNALIHLYSKCGDIGSARKLFGDVPVNSSVNWNTLISACLSCGDVEYGRKLFDEMPGRDTRSWNGVIAGYCRLGEVDAARSLFDEMGEQEKDVVSWAVMISSYARSGRAREALEIFKTMQFAGVCPDNVTLTCALCACAQTGALETGRWIHSKYVNRISLRNDVHLGTALVDMYAKCGCIHMAEEVFDNMPNKTTCTWNAMLSGLAIHGHGQGAIDLLQEMESEGAVPDEVTFTAVLSACSHAGAILEGKRQFRRMQEEFKITPKIEHCGCMVDLLGRGGLIDEAEEVIRGMPMKPNLIIWGSLLNACMIHGYTCLDHDLLAQFHDLGEEEEDDDDGGPKVLLSNIYATNGEWDMVEVTRKILRKGSVKKKKNKTPGCSSVEVDSIVHEFVVEDRSHFQWNQIKEIVQRLNSHSEIENCMSSISFQSGD